MILPGVDGEPFSYSAPVLADRAVRVVFGIGSLDHVAPEARTLGARVMIISGRHEAEAADVVAGQLGDDLAWRISNVVQHVPGDVATQAREAARDAGAGVLISIGGGSATSPGCMRSTKHHGPTVRRLFVGNTRWTPILPTCAVAMTS